MTISVYWDVVFADAMEVILFGPVLEFDAVATVLPVSSLPNVLTYHCASFF